MSGPIAWALFLGLSTIAVVTAAGMLVTMSMYRAGLALMSSFVALAGLFLLLDADLLAAIQVMMNVGGMLVMVLFMVMLMIDPGGEMMWDMKRQMHLPGPGAFSMSMPRGAPPEDQQGPGQHANREAATRDDWTCPMHPEVSEPGPGDCPKCGMPLVPRADLAGQGERPQAEQGQSYTCPMHPEVREDHPGQCPICGMDLVPAVQEQPTSQGWEHQHHQGHREHGDEATMYTCPMHPEVRQQGPGQCPICGMDLVPVNDQQATQRDEQHASGATVYTCPMHPEVRQGHPGQCPICGMDLVPAGDRAAQELHQHGERTMPMAHEGSDQGRMAMGGMSPGQHYQMMVGMAMSTAQLPWALAIGTSSAVVLIALVAWTPWPLVSSGPTADATSAVGELLLSRYMVAFEGAAFLILAGIVGAVIFAKREPASRGTPRAGAPAGLGLYTCPMHPQVRQEGPGQCPICGMDLVPAEAGQERPAHPHEHGADGATTYTCPMHPEVRQDQPGQCPKCGMELVPAEPVPARVGHSAPAQGGES